MTTAKESGRGCPLLRPSNHRRPARCSFQAHSSSLQEWGCLISHCVPVLFHQNSFYCTPLECRPCWSHYDRRTSTFRSCPFREQGISMGIIPLIAST